MKIVKYNGYNVYIQEKNNLSVRLLQTSGSLLPLSQIVSLEGEVVSITNCSYFFSEGGYNYTNGRNQGDTLNTTYGNNDNEKYCDICIYEDGTWYAGKFNNWDHTENYRDVENGVCAGFSVACFLVLNGIDEYSYSTAFNGDKASARNPQTAFAILSDGNMLQIVSEGRNSVGNGLTGYELLDCIREQGYNNIELFALLDGGDSSEMIVNGEIVNNLSGGSERKMLNGIAFIDILSDNPEPENKKDISTATVLLSQNSYIYNGKECEPKVTIILDNITLVQDIDYVVSYESNINPGRAIINIVGINDYIGSITERFQIQKISILDNIEISWSNDTEMCIYTGNPFEPEFTIFYNGNKLVEGQDFVKEYFNNIQVGDEASVKIIGMGNFQGEMIYYFSIWERDINEVKCTVEETEYIYTGSAIVPVVHLEYNNKLLIENIDYTIEYLNNIETGIALAVVYGIGNFWKSFNFVFNIKKKNIFDEDILTNTVTQSIYTGEQIIPDLNITFNEIKLRKDYDYIFEIWDNINAGTGYIKLIGINNFSGEKEISFTINPASLEKDISNFSFNIIGELIYNGLAQLPEIEIFYLGKKIFEDIDYTLSGNNNIEATQSALVTIFGKGNFTDSVIKTFEIKPSTDNLFDLILIEGDKYEYTSYPIKPSFKLLLDDKDYFDFAVDYSNNIDVSNNGAKITVTVLGNYSGQIEKTFSILPSSIEKCSITTTDKEYSFINGEISPKLNIVFNGRILPEENFYEIIKYENNINVTNAAKIFYKFISDNFIEKDEPQELLFTINPANISACTVVFKNKDIIFTGEELTPEFTITLGGVEVDKENYIYSYSNNINAGLYAGLLNLSGKNNLKNSTIKSFTINRVVLNTENCIMRADEYEPGEGLYNMDTLKVYWKKSDEEEVLLYLASPQDYSKELLDEKNLDQEIVETTVTITGLGNYSGKVINVFATGTLGMGDFTDAFGQLDKKPGYTYISYSDEMENMFRISPQGKSAIDELNTQLYNHGYANESVTINTIPIYYLKPNTIIYIRDEETKINGEYVISKINIPLGNSGSMSITATKAMKRDY